MDVVQITRITRKTHTFTVPPELGSPSTVSVALLPKRAWPNELTTWQAVDSYDVGTRVATITLAGPDADPTGALVVPGTSGDLLVADLTNPDIDAVKVERINVQGGSALAAVPPSALDLVTEALAAKVDVTDSRLTDARTPIGGAGGALSGQYPSPGLNTAAVDTSVAANVNDDASETRAALDGRYDAAGAASDAQAAAVAAIPSMSAIADDPALRAALVARSVPSYAGTRTRTWDPSLCGYNLESAKLRTFRSIVRGARAGGPAKRVLAAGDSKTGGAGVGGAASTLSMPAQLMDLLGGKPGYVQVNGDDNQWALGPGLSYSADPAQAFIAYPSGGGTLTFTPRSDVTFTGFKVAAYSGGGGSLSVAVDGGAPATQTVSTSPGNFHYLTAITGLADTTHTVTITSSNDAVLVSGIELTYATATGLRVINAGRGGSDAQNWLPINWSTMWDATFGNTIYSPPDAAILNLGTNNNGGTATPAMLGTIAGNIDALGVPLLLVVFGGIDHAGDLDARRSALYDAADTYDLPLVDFTALIGDNAAATAAGLMADGVHENARGYSLEAATVARILSPA